MRIRKKNLWAVLLLALVLAFAGCQTSAARESVENVRTEEGSTDSTETADSKTDSGEETADSETDSGEESGEEAADSAAASTEEPQYIDEEYVDEHYGETEEEDLSKYSADTSSSAGQSGVSSEDSAGNDGGQENGDATSVQEEASAENYYTDPVPEGMPQPVEPQDEVVNTDQTLTCTLMVECSTILNNMENLTEGKESWYLPMALFSDRQRLPSTTESRFMMSCSGKCRTTASIWSRNLPPCITVPMWKESIICMNLTAAAGPVDVLRQRLVSQLRMQPVSGAGRGCD